MNEEPYHSCERCGSFVSPEDPNLVRAVEVRRFDSIGGHYVDGMAALFHDYCWPMDGYRLPTSLN